MKKFKKIAALLLAMVMALAMAVPAMAAETGSITVSGADGATIKYGQLVMEDNESSLGWAFVGGKTGAIAQAFISAFNTDKDGDGDVDADDAIKSLIDIGVLGNATAASGAINTSSELGTALAALTAYATTEITETNPATGLAKGLYIVTALKTGYTYIPMAAYVNNTEATVKAKGSENKTSKTVKDAKTQSVTGNDTAEYIIEVEYPYYAANAENKTFRVEDTLTNATNNKDLVVKVDGTELPATSDTGVVNYTVSYSDDATTMTVTFTYNADYAGKQVTLEYTAKVAATVTMLDTLGNKAITYTSDNNGNEKATQAIVNSCSTKVTVTKVDAENAETKLDGAVFTLYVEDENGTDSLTYGDKTVKVSVVTTATTANGGLAVFDGLDAQKQYYVVETTAPAGYSLNTTVYKLSQPEITTTGPVDSEEIDANGNKIATKTTTYSTTDMHILNADGSQAATDNITDTQLSSLPSTGGIGTTIFTVAGCMIMIAAGGMLIVSRRRKNA